MNQDFEILNSIIDQIAVIDQKGTIVFTNHSWTEFGRNNNSIVSKTGPGVNYLNACFNVNHEDDGTALNAWKGIMSVIERKATIFELEYPCHSIDEKRWFIMRVNPFEFSQELTIISHINITQRKIAEEENERHVLQLNTVNERLKSTLMKIVHDIQNPLTSIEGLVNLSKPNEEKQEIDPYFSMIESSIANLKQYIQDTLNYFSSGVLIESIDFKQILSDFVHSVKYSESMQLVKIEVKVTQEITFYSDKAEIGLIISNILGNSLKYFDPKKNENFIEVTVTVSEKEAVLHFFDNGIGIEKELHSKIFDLNFQAEKQYSTGAGIGLHLVQKSVEALGGSIRINSTKGISTEFIVTLPNLMGIV